MPSSVWSGHLHFGLVVMPVRLLVGARTKVTRFRRLYRKPIAEGPYIHSSASYPRDLDDHTYGLHNGSPHSEFNPEELKDRDTSPPEYSAVRQVLQSQLTGEEIRSDETVKGYEIAPNEFAAIDPQEIRAAEIETSDTIDLFHFVKATTVDPIYFERSYYVAPDVGAEKGCALLLEAMQKEECVGIARIGMHRREHMLILRPADDHLVAHTMFYENEVRTAPRLDVSNKFTTKELSMAVALIKGYEGKFDPTQFKDLYQERIHKIIDAKVSNRIETMPAPASSSKTAPDLMEQIRLSLAQLESNKRDAKKPVQKTPTVGKKKPRRVLA
jgi:DNA end-binding protein Ku